MDKPAGPQKPAGSDRKRRLSRPADIQRQLDEALADSFPASDPVSIVTSQAEEDWDERAGEDGTVGTAEDGAPGAGQDAAEGAQGAVSSRVEPA